MKYEEETNIAYIAASLALRSSGDRGVEGAALEAEGVEGGLEDPNDPADV